MDSFDSICDELRKTPGVLGVVDQFRRAAYFEMVCLNAGFSRGRTASIKSWIRNNPEADRSIFVAWVQVMEDGNVLLEDEDLMWLEVAVYLAYGGEVEGRPADIALCEANAVRWFKNHMVSKYSHTGRFLSMD